MKGTVAERLEAYTHRTDYCHEWTGSRNGDGYGCLNIGGKSLLVHRVTWEMANSPVPDGLFVLHHCDNPPCRRLDHLFLGTKADNSADCVAKGRIHNMQKTHCVNGHPFNDANTYRWVDGRRQCLTCKAERDAARYAAMPARPEGTLKRPVMSQKMKAIWARRRTDRAAAAGAA